MNSKTQSALDKAARLLQAYDTITQYAVRSIPNVDGSQVVYPTSTLELDITMLGSVFSIIWDAVGLNETTFSEFYNAKKPAFAFLKILVTEGRYYDLSKRQFKHEESFSVTEFYHICSVLNSLRLYYLPIHVSTDEYFQKLQVKRPYQLEDAVGCVYLLDHHQPNYVLQVDSIVLLHNLRSFLNEVTQVGDTPFFRNTDIDAPSLNRSIKMLSEPVSAHAYIPRNEREILADQLKTLFLTYKLLATSMLMEPSIASTKLVSRKISLPTMTTTTTSTTTKSEPPHPSQLDTLICPITHTLPVMPVKLGHKYYEKDAIVRYLKQQQEEGKTELKDPYRNEVPPDYEASLTVSMEHLESVRKWIVSNPNTDDTFDWIIRSLGKLSRLRLFNFVKEKLGIKKTAQYGDSVAIVDEVSEGFIVKFLAEVNIPNIEKAIRTDILSVRSVAWAKLCWDEDKRLFIGVALRGVADIEIVNEVRQAWHKNPILSERDICFVDTMVKPFKDPSPSPFGFREQARSWWMQHQHTSLELFQKHSNLNAYYLDYPVRNQSLITNELALILCVSHKGFIPHGEELFPVEYMGIATDVRSGNFRLCGRHPHPNAMKSDIPLVGSSIGSTVFTKAYEHSGTAGAILKSQGDLFVLTAQHVVQENNGQSNPVPGETKLACPSQNDRPPQHFGTELIFHCGAFGKSVQVPLLGKSVQVTVDAAVLKVQEAKPQTTEVEFDYCSQPRVYNQKSTTVELEHIIERKCSLSFFGRSSGPTGNSDLDCVGFGMANLRPDPVPAGQLEFPFAPATLQRHTFTNQFLVRSRERNERDEALVEPGDSGSGLWSTEDDGLSLAGLIIGSMERGSYAVVTPIDAVLACLATEADSAFAVHVSTD